MDCIELRNMINAFMDGELEPMTAKRMERHIKECPSCTRELNSLIRARKLVKSLDPVEVPEEVSACLRLKIEAFRQQREDLKGRLYFFRRPAVRAAAAAAVVVLAFGVGLGIRNYVPRQTSVRTIADASRDFNMAPNFSAVIPKDSASTPEPASESMAMNTGIADSTSENDETSIPYSTVENFSGIPAAESKPFEPAEIASAPRNEMLSAGRPDSVPAADESKKGKFAAGGAVVGTTAPAPAPALAQPTPIETAKAMFSESAPDSSASGLMDRGRAAAPERSMEVAMAPATDGYEEFSAGPGDKETKTADPHTPVADLDISDVSLGTGGFQNIRPSLNNLERVYTPPVISNPPTLSSLGAFPGVPEDTLAAIENFITIFIESDYNKEYKKFKDTIAKMGGSVISETSIEEGKKPVRKLLVSIPRTSLSRLLDLGQSVPGQQQVLLNLNNSSAGTAGKSLNVIVVIVLRSK